MWREWKTGEVHTTFWWGKHEGWRRLGGPGHRLEHNIEMIFSRLGGDMNWLAVAQDGAVVNAVMNIRVP